MVIIAIIIIVIIARAFIGDHALNSRVEVEGLIFYFYIFGEVDVIMLHPAL